MKPVKQQSSQRKNIKENHAHKLKENLKKRSAQQKARQQDRSAIKNKFNDI